MYSHEEILKKLNADNVGELLTLADIMPLSPAQLRNLAGSRLTHAEVEALYSLAQEADQENTIFESRLLSRGNPQLKSLKRLEIAPLQETRGYTDMFERRADSYVAPGSVSSMFSPAAYLTELYREASPLHPDASAYYLKKRRPDLGQLLLSQANMDTEVSTLALSNEILMDNIANHHTWSPEQVTETLSTYRLSGNTPYHSPYDAIRQSILQQDPGLSALAHSPYFSTQLSPQVLMALEMAMPPELLAILTEEVTDENAEILYEKNFGALSIDYLSSVSNLAHYYDLSMEEVTTLISSMAASSTYQDNKLNSVVIDGGGRVNYFDIAVSLSSGARYPNYTNLIPLMGGEWCYEFSMAKVEPDQKSVSLIWSQGSHGGTLYEGNAVLPVNTNFRFLVGVVNEDLNGSPLVSIVTLCKDSTDTPVMIIIADFTVDAGSKKSALYFNKLIRLYKAFGISLSDMERFLLHAGSQTVINEAVLTRSAYAKYLSQQYGIPLDSALMFGGIEIGTRSTSELPSQFDLLFNTPPLNGQTFALGGAVIEVDPSKLDPADSFRRAVLKRAWQVDDAGLYQMHLIGNRAATTGINNTLADLSDLYRIALLAQAHALTIDELNTLLLLSPYKATNLYGIDEPTLKALTQYLFFVTEWLAAQKWSVYQLFVMVSDTYSTVWTPALDNLQQTLLNGLGTENELLGDELVIAMAPFIASSLHLNTSNLAESILRWANQIKPNGQTVDSFWSLIQKETPTETERNNIIAFAQVLAQLSIIVNTVNISEQELALLVGNPALLSAGTTALGLNVDILQQVTLFHRWINGSGTYVNEVLTALNDGTLSAELLANSLQDEVTRVTQAMAKAVPGSTALAHWNDVFVVIQWLKVAAALNITPDSVADLMALTYDSTTTYATWSSLGDMMLGGLDSQQSEVVKSSLDEQLGGALSTYYIREVSPVFLNSRDALYSYLLIDNQVSAQVKTSRIAEAIASVQLYVYRTLNGQETDADTAVATRQFFVDWDAYNARYSTWAGVSQLVYYPENYVDPTMRLGQTQMMDDMLQDISQSNLNTDTVDVAFKSYLTQFEEVANLSVVSGYHDNINFDFGLTYFIGKSPDNDSYYWRTVDQNLFTIEGKYPANAWSEWGKIETAITPFLNMARPVIFNSRLNVAWFERENITTKNSQGMEEVIYKNTVKLSKLGYDGAWGEVRLYNVDAAVLSYSESEFSDLGFYCSSSMSMNVIVVLFYIKMSTADENKATRVSGLYIYPDMTAKYMSVEEAESVRDIVFRDFDTSEDYRVVKEFSVNNYSFPDSVNSSTSYVWGADYLTLVSGGKVNSIKIESATIDNITLNLDASLRVCYPGSGNRQMEQCMLMKKFYNTEKMRFAVYDEYKTIAVNTFYCLYAIDSKALLSINPHFSSNFFWHTKEGGGESKFGIPYAYYVKMPTTILNDSGSNLDWIEDSLFYRTNILSSYTIDTDVLPQDVVVTMTAGNAIKTFSAEVQVASQPSFNLTEMIYNFSDMSFDIPATEFVNNSVTVNVKCTAKAVGDRYLGEENFEFVVNRQALNGEAISLSSTDTYAQYLQRDVRRVRTNTLFAQQLIAKANAGVDQVLTMETQLLPEPQMGNGGYIDVTLPVYDTALHGTSRAARVTIWRGTGDEYYDFWSGSLLDSEQKIKLFVPLSQMEAPFYDITNFPYGADSGLKVYLSVNGERKIAGTLGTAIQGNSLVITGYTPDSSPSMSIVPLPDTTEPMDFTGANALYFWEMFYYTPMMVYLRLLQESKFDEALTWIKYIWSPSGYISSQGSKAPYNWNCRPLEEDTSWNATPLDSVDPDAVAQNDPMHYKVATFMSMLDLLIARGDAAYRQLERDTLNEAKMWYMQALNLLGDEPYVPLNGEWADPSLDSAASTTTQSAYQQALLTLRETGLPAPMTANSLTALFLPEVNGKLQGYWQLLAQRLYNLRHNLSIDGQPLSLPLYATPVSPEALQSAAVASSQGGGTLPPAVMPLYRFPVILGNTRTLVGQLMQFGSSLLGIIERQDSEAMAELLQTQARDLSVTAIAMQDKAIAEVDADEQVLQCSRQGAQSRFDAYVSLYDENINTGEQQAMDLYLSASVIAASGDALRTTAAAMNLVPNIYGFAVGGTVYGAAFDAMAISTDIASQATRISADRISYSETYRRRRQEWAIQRNNAEDELKQIDAQLASLSIRRESAVLQKTYLETQQAQTQAQLEFLQRKFSNKALYNWLRGCLSAIYYQFYDLTVSRCLMSQEAYRWEMNQPQASFIKPGAWNSTYAGLMAGENLMLNLTQMEDAYLKQDERPMEVTRTVSLAQLYAALPDDNDFVLADEVDTLINSGSGQAGTTENGIKLESGTLTSSIKLSDLNITADYPAGLGDVRRIKQISVTLPLLMGPYQDVQAVLNYGGSVVMPRGCNTLAVSHGMNDSGQFQLDFNDAQFLPFEGIPVNDNGTLTLSFPNATGKQETVLLSLSDIILHIRYTIRH
ncbi:TPA: neuraminidase-like domain-containing protein [Pseudomonas aeruginosa]